MGQLRARQPEEKAERRGEILACAARLWRMTPFAEIKMADVAREAGLAKGTLYLYFATKEELFLALLEARLYPWMQQLAVDLDGLAGATATTVARVCRTAFARDAELDGLLPLLESVLERGISLETAGAFKRRLWLHVVPLGAAFERALPGVLRAGQGAEVVVAVRALHTGFRQMADASAVVREVLDRNPELAPMRVEFGRDFEAALTRLLAGFAAEQVNEGEKA